MEAILIPLTVFACIFGVVYIFLTTRNKERLALIEKGASADLFSMESSGKLMLKIGVLSIGVAVGILCANLLSKANLLDEKVACPAMIFLFAGIALVATHLFANKGKDKGEV